MSGMRVGQMLDSLVDVMQTSMDKVRKTLNPTILDYYPHYDMEDVCNRTKNCIELNRWFLAIRETDRGKAIRIARAHNRIHHGSK